jgi:hypothetical protein
MDPGFFASESPVHTALNYLLSIINAISGDRCLLPDRAEGGSDHVDLKDFPDGRARLYPGLFVRVLQLAGIEYSDWFGIS